MDMSVDPKVRVSSITLVRVQEEPGGARRAQEDPVGPRRTHPGGARGSPCWLLAESGFLASSRHPGAGQLRCGQMSSVHGVGNFPLRPGHVAVSFLFQG